MIRKSVFAVWIILFFTGCRDSNDMPNWPPFVMMIPDDIPDKMEVYDKDGTVRILNGKEAYAGGYRAAWKRCVWDYEQGELNLDLETIAPPPLGHYNIVVEGWNDGYRVCHSIIRNAKKE